MTHLLHVTVDTGDAYRSGRDTVDERALDAAQNVLRRALFRPTTPRRTAEMLRVAEGGEMAIAVLDTALEALHPTLIAPARHHPMREWTLTAAAQGRALLGTICAPPDMHLAPVLSFGVAPTSRSAPRLWGILLAQSAGRGRAVGDPKRPPPAPWLATRMEIGAQLIRNPNAFLILADFQRCAAWAWLAL